MEKQHYDYAIGLETPYWIQEIRLRGKVYWTFQTPLSVPFLGVTALSAVAVFLFIHPLLQFLDTFLLYLLLCVQYYLGL